MMKNKIGYIIAIIVLLITTSVICSCKSVKYVPISETHTDTLYKASKDSVKWIYHTNIKDSTRIKDSIVIHINDKGEVTGTDMWHWREKCRTEKDSTWYYKSRLDSVLHSKTDSVPTPYPFYKDKYIDKKLSWWQTFALDIGYVFIGVVLLAIVYFIVKLWKKINVTSLIKKIL